MRLLFLLSLLALPVAVQAQFSYTTSGSSATITGWTNANGAVVIPATITNGSVYTVTGIGSNAFALCTNLTSVNIPINVTSIGTYAFLGCTNLTFVVIPYTVTSIGDDAFALCAGLKSAYFEGNAPPDDGTVFFGDINTIYYAFATTGWKATFGGLPAVEETASDQFKYTTSGDSLTITGYAGPGGAVVIPNPINGYTVIGIAGNAFASSSLGSVIIPNSITTIGNSAFQGCTGLTNVTIPNSVTSAGAQLFENCTSLTSVSIPNSVTSIGDRTFYDCASLGRIVIPNSLISIGDRAFQACNSLTGIFIPSSVTSIGDYAFQACAALTSAYFQSNAPPDDGTVFDSDPAATVYYLPGTTGWGATFGSVPTVQETAPSQFNYTTSGGTATITGYTGPGGAVVIPNPINGYTVTSLAGGAFQGRSSLTSIIIPNSVTDIGDYAFFICSSLTNITIPNSVTGISQYMFQECFSLASVTIPNSVTNIGDGAFFDCTSLTNVTIPNSVTDIGEYAFYSCASLPSVNLPNTVTAIGSYAFGSCDSLTSFTIPNSVTIIGDVAFFNDTNLTSVTIPSSVTGIGDDAFQNCGSLKYAFFQGNAPPDDGTVFDSDSTATVYYLPATTGWGATFGSVTAMLLPSPKVLINDPTFGVHNNQFGFTISWPIIGPVVVQAATNLANPVWVSISTNSLANGTNHFRDANWTNYPGRFYRLNTPH